MRLIPREIDKLLLHQGNKEKLNLNNRFILTV
jgi:hypothetical protein